MAQETLSLDFGPSVISSSPPPAAPAAPSPSAAAAPAAATPAAQPATPAAAPVPGPDRVKVGEREFTAQELNDIASYKAAEDSRRATLPVDPNGYKAELPPDFKPPEGVT